MLEHEKPKLCRGACGLVKAAYMFSWSSARGCRYRRARCKPCETAATVAKYQAEDVEDRRARWRAAYARKAARPGYLESRRKYQGDRKASVPAYAEGSRRSRRDSYHRAMGHEVED